MCVSAIIDSGTTDPEGLAALEKGEEWLIKNLPHVRRADPEAIYNSWCHAYSIEALTRMYVRVPDDQKRRAEIVELIESQIDLLSRYECVDGGWCYYDFDYRTKQPGGSSISFVTAAVLVAFHDAQKIGIEIPERPGRARRRLHPPAAESGLLLLLRRVSQVSSSLQHQPSGRKPGPIPGLQSRHALLG